MSPRGPSVYPSRRKWGQRAGSTGAFGDRISRQTAPGARRQPTLFATWIVWDPATATPISPTTIWIPQITARMRSAWPLEGEVSQIVTCAIGSQEAITRQTPNRMRSARVRGFVIGSTASQRTASGGAPSWMIDHLAGLVQVIAGEAPVRSCPRTEVHQVPGAEVAPGAVVGAVDGAGRAEAGGVVAGRARAARGRGWAAGGRRGRAHVAPVGGHPVACLDALRLAQRELSRADQLVQPVLEDVLRACPPAAGIGLGPKVRDRV